jgi:mannose/cellobiose epimerase-like protein (N-acyl-D-glucosamine 2-epimerase family)
MHAVEAFLTAADATGDDRWLDRAEDIATRLVDEVAEHTAGGSQNTSTGTGGFCRTTTGTTPTTRSVPSGHPGTRSGMGSTAAAPRGGPRSQGHRAVRSDRSAAGLPWAVPAAKALFERAVADGWDSRRGGFVYTTDWEGTPVVDRRFHWVVAEAIGAAAALARATGDPRYQDWFHTFWDYARRTLVEPAGFGWLHEVDRDGRLSEQTWCGRPDWYHAIQATLIPRLPLAPSLPAALRLAHGPAGPGRRPGRG